MPENARPRYEGTVTLGNILTVIGFLIAAFSAFYAVRTELAVVSTRVERMEQQIEQVAQVLVADARRDEQISELQRRISALESYARGDQ